VPTVLLVRHGRTTANASGVLAGWSPDVHLDDTGRAQAVALAQRLADVPLTAVVSSPLDRCQETVGALLENREYVPVHHDERVGECHYGDWTGRELKTLVKEPLWKVVQSHPSAARFPGDDGESLADMSARAVAAVRSWNAKLGDDATYVVCSHGDVIKAILADAFGMHLDEFQRIVVDPCSLSVVRYTELRPFVERVNDSGGAVGSLLPPKRKAGRKRKASSDAVVGGGAGAEAPAARPRRAAAK
jgi:probable phosphomutase (TIGR03848 family)